MSKNKHAWDAIAVGVLLAVFILSGVISILLATGHLKLMQLWGFVS